MLDPNALLLSLIPEDSSPEVMVLDAMNIMVKLNNIPMAYRNPEVTSRLCAAMGMVVEVIPPKGQYYHEYVRVKVQIQIFEPLQWGTYLRLRNSSRPWISFTYERLPIYCFLCGRVGYMEKKCQLRFDDGFVDPGRDFPYGEWLKAFKQGANFMRARLVPATVSSTRNSRGSSIFKFASPELESRARVDDGRDLVQGNTRALVKPSQTNNRKKKVVEMELGDDIRPQKRQTLGEITQLFSVPVEAATQPHRQ